MIRHVLNKLGSFRIALVAGVGFSLVAASAFAQNASPTPAGEGAPGAAAASSGANAAATGGSSTTAEAERVIVTGSNIPTAEEVGPNPVDTYRAEDIVKLGVRTTTDLQQKIPASTGGAINENIANGGDGRVEINLRGILPKETLILVDGRRLAPDLFGASLGGQSVNVNFIPFAAVDHIDILKDGASAIYGSDAVSGVFNAYMKHKFRGLEIEASYGNTNLGASNDAGEREGYILAGTGDDKTDVVVFAQYYDRAAIFSIDRDISRNANFSRFGGGDIRSGNFPGRVGSRVFIPGTGTSAFGPNTPTPHAFPNARTDPEYEPRAGINPATDRFAFNFAALTPAIPADDKEYFYGSFVRDLCDKYLTVFADFKFARTFFDAGAAPTPFTPDPFLNEFGGPFDPAGISVPIQNAFNPFTVADRTTPSGIPVTSGVRFRGLEAGLRTVKITDYDYLFNAGIRGQLGEFGDFFKTWGYESSFRYESVYQEDLSGGIVSKPGLRDALLDTNPATAFNPFGILPNTQAAQSRVYVTLHHNSVNTLALEDFKLYGDVFNLPAGPISIAGGVEHRTERYKDRPDSLNTTFSTIGSTDLEASQGNRDVWSAYGEIRIPVTSPSWNFPAFYSLEFDLAERYDYFSDFGDSETPKISVRWQPIDSSLTLRGTYSEAFHSPFLNEVSPARAESFPLIVDPIGNLGGNSAYQPREISGGNPDLKPEKAYEWTYGAIWSPKWVKGLTLGADFYHIDLRNVVSTFGVQFLVDNPNLFPGRVVRDTSVTDPTAENYQVITQINNQNFNLGRVIEEGYDFEAIYQLDTSIFGHGSFGTFTWTANATYLSRFEFAAQPGGKEIDETGNFLDFGSLPHWKGYASMFYDLGGLDTGATVHYVGQYNDSPGAANTITGNRKIREWTTLDLLVSYTFNLAAPVEQPVAGYAKDGGKNVKMRDGKDKNVMPVSTAEFNPCGWRAWLNGTTITVGMNNVFDQDPPFTAGSFENGYDESIADVKGRFWYVSLKKRF
jgi:iron complex outermembrane receptor protein